MIFRILKKDFERSKTISITLFIFVLLAALLTSMGMSIGLEIFGSMKSLFEKSKAPHYVHMYSGNLDQQKIDDFSKENKLVKAQQSVELLNINSSNIFWKNVSAAKSNSIFENGFVKQNDKFDFLLDMRNQILKVDDGEIGVPVYYMDKGNLKVGDKIEIINGSFSMEFIIKDFVRDVQMNSSFVTSKRFLVSENDWNRLTKEFGETEYLIEFLLSDASKTNEFERQYQSSDLPQAGITITHHLYYILNALSDGILAGIILLTSIVLVAIAIMCLRFTLITTIEEDYREIGVMRAIGIQNRDIQRIYMAKYLLLSSTACICGYFISWKLYRAFISDIVIYMGRSPRTIWHKLIPFTGVVTIFLVISVFCYLVLKRLKKISVVDAIRMENSINKTNRELKLTLKKSGFLNLNVFLGVREVLGRFSRYGLLLIIYAMCSFLMIVPINFVNTVEDPEFISYMGAAKCDIRIDLQKSKDIEQQFNHIIENIKKDDDIERYAAFTTSSFKVKNKDGEFENINVEVGDFDVFPLEYVGGFAPSNENEIALSFINAKELNKSVGDTVILRVNDKGKKLIVTGIYQDITNGGKTAKARLAGNTDKILWYTINLNAKPGIDVKDKIAQYSSMFHQAKVTDVEDYVQQTLGTLIRRMDVVVKSSVAVSILIAILITAMFFKMIIAKEVLQIEIMRRIGFSIQDIRIQYMARFNMVLVAAVLIGIFTADIIGSKVIGGLFWGLPDLKFKNNLLAMYFICPVSLVAAVSTMILIESISIGKVQKHMQG